MTAPSPRAIERAMAEAMRLRATLPDDDDMRLLLDTIEGQTNALELLDRVAEQAVADTKLAELAAARGRRLLARAERARDLALRMMLALEIGDTLERATYTASISRKTKVHVTGNVPEAFMRHAPDKDLIGKVLRDGKTVENATLSNPEPHISIRAA